MKVGGHLEMTFRSFDQAKDKGAIGEIIVRQYLEKAGWVVYQPMTEGAHCFDMMCIKDKRTSVAFDIKAKARLNAWPATGVNQRHFEEYQAFSEKHNMPFWIVFVDEGCGEVYGNTIQQLEIKRVVKNNIYPRVMDWRPKIRLWPLEAMRPIAKLTSEQISALSKLNQRSYEFEGNT